MARAGRPPISVTARQGDSRLNKGSRPPAAMMIEMGDRAQQARLDELDSIESRTDAEEIEYLTLSWFTGSAKKGRKHQANSARCSVP
jgi:hypothetical protein